MTIEPPQRAVRRRDRRRHAAVHEAGHAVIADPNVTLARWKRIGRFRGDDEHTAFRARIIAHMAGAEVEFALLGACVAGDGCIGEEIALMLDSMGFGQDSECERQDARPRRATRRAVCQNVGQPDTGELSA